MAGIRTLFAAILLALCVAVQEASAQCSRGGTLTATVTADIAPLATCTAVTGSIEAKDVTGLDLGDIEIFDGSILITETEGASKGPSLRGRSVRNITRSLSVMGSAVRAAAINAVEVDLPNLAFVNTINIDGPFMGLDFAFGPNLTVGGPISISQTVLDELALNVQHVKGPVSVYRNKGSTSTVCNFSSGLVTAQDTLEIYSNDGITSISMPQLEDVAAEMRIYANPLLTTIDLGLVQTQFLAVSDNGRETTVNLSRLVSAGQSLLPDAPADSWRGLIFRNLLGLSLPALRDVTDPDALLELFDNLFVDVALPQLRTVNSTLNFNQNRFLAAAALPRLESIGGQFLVQKNPRLLNLTANSLERVGSVLLQGNFTNVEMFALKAVLGDFVVMGAPQMDCSWFDENVGPIVRGEYKCGGNHTKPAVPRVPSTPVPGEDEDGVVGGGGGGGMGVGAKAGIGVGAGVGVLLAGVVLWFVLRRRKTAATANGAVEEALDGPGELDGKASARTGAVVVTSELDSDAQGGAELDGEAKVGELPVDSVAEPQELSGATPASELPETDRSNPVELP